MLGDYFLALPKAFSLLRFRRQGTTTMIKVAVGQMTSTSNKIENFEVSKKQMEKF